MALSLPSSASEMFGLIINSFAVSIAVFWLLADKLRNRKRIITFLLTFLVMAVTCVMGIISFAGLDFSKETLASVILLAVVILTTLFGFTLAGWRCRKTYGPLRFMLWLCIWMVIICLAFMLIYFGVMFIVYTGRIPPISVLIAVLLTSGLVVSGSAYAILFPFMLLVFNNNFFRRRFYACFHLKSMQPPLASIIDTEQTSDQHPNLQIPEDDINNN